MKKNSIALCLFSVFCAVAYVVAQDAKMPSELEKYVQDAQDAEKEMNASKACSAYANAVEYCRKNSG